VHGVADGYWERVGSRPVRPVSSVILPSGQAEAILADCREFLASEPWYAHHGIPHRRGYLLHGEPGSGKTSLVTALAGSLGVDVYVITLSSPSMTDENLRSLLNSAADRSLLLLEDVDAAFVGRTAAAASLGAGGNASGGGGGGAPALSFSGLLNAIDGVAAQEGRLLFMTTNHVERLSSALVRPGRVDYRLEFRRAEQDQSRRLFLSFYQSEPAAAAQAAPRGRAGTISARLCGDGDTNSSAADAGALGAAAAAADVAPAVSAAGGGDRTSNASPAAHPDHAPAKHRAVPSPGGGGGTAAASADVHTLADEFASLIPAASVNMAQLQGYLMQHKRDAAGAVRGVPAWLRSLT